MPFLSRFSPIRAYRDLRFFLAGRQPHELGFLVLAMAITGVLVFIFARDSNVAPVYKRDIVYVQQWRLDRTDAEIRAQQKIDAPIKAKRLAEEQAERDKTKAMFKKADDALTKWGL